MMADPTTVEREQKLAEVSSEVSQVMARAQAIEVESETQAQEATGLLAEIKASKTRSERARTFLVAPLNAHVRKINATFKETTTPLEVADRMVRRKVLAFRYEQERQRERVQARLDEERRTAEEQARSARRVAWEQSRAAERESCLSERAENARRAAEEATQRHIATQAAPQIVAAAPAPLNADSGSASVRQRWVAVVVNADSLPREYLMPDVGKINRAVREGARVIPGVRIEQVSGLAVRAR